MKFSSILSRFFKITIFSAAAIVLSACGQRGPLIHPDNDRALSRYRAATNTAPNNASSTAAAQPQQSTSQKAAQPDASAATQTNDVKPSASDSSN